tara:strand:- start:63613 stop:63822 length:210 start_codon:yes stop_codon:yes gene_type:complete
VALVRRQDKQEIKPMMPDRSRYANNPTITIEYDCRGKRTTKDFACVYEARRFYFNKTKANKNPKLIKGE